MSTFTFTDIVVTNPGRKNLYCIRRSSNGKFCLMVMLPTREIRGKAIDRYLNNIVVLGEEKAHEGDKNFATTEKVARFLPDGVESPGDNRKEIVETKTLLHPNSLPEKHVYAILSNIPKKCTRVEEFTPVVLPNGKTHLIGYNIVEIKDRMEFQYLDLKGQKRSIFTEKIEERYW